MEEIEEPKYFECCCHSPEHQIVVKYLGGGDPWVFFTFHLNPEWSFFKRIWHAIKYVFGYRCQYGDFDEIVMDKVTFRKFIRSLDEIDIDMYINDAKLNKPQPPGTRFIPED